MKTKIEADLIPVLGEIDHARTGDFLIVVRGVCIGVQCKEDWPALPPPPQLRSSSTVPRNEVHHSPVEADVIDAIEKLTSNLKSTNSMNIAETLGIERGDKIGRSMLSQVIQSLKKRSLIKKETDDRIPNYVICNGEL